MSAEKETALCFSFLGNVHSKSSAVLFYSHLNQVQSFLVGTHAIIFISPQNSECEVKMRNLNADVLFCRGFTENPGILSEKLNLR